MKRIVFVKIICTHLLTNTGESANRLQDGDGVKKVISVVCKKVEQNHIPKQPEII
jgi:hypothetical protein